jgi:YHS domain-containing protein
MRPVWKAVLPLALLTILPANLCLAAGEQPSSPPAEEKAIRPQTKCPVMGGTIDKSLYVDAKGKRIYLCCAACEEAVRTEPEKYIKKIEQRGESVADTPPSP